VGVTLKKAEHKKRKKDQNKVIRGAAVKNKMCNKSIDDKFISRKRDNNNYKRRK
jgi:hypothetical protein